MAFPSWKQLFSMYRLTVLFAIALPLWAQDSTQSWTEDKRILWAFTNHRTIDDSPTLPNLTPRGKLAMHLAMRQIRRSSFKPPLFRELGRLRMPTRLSGKGSRGTPNDSARRTLILQ